MLGDRASRISKYNIYWMALLMARGLWTGFLGPFAFTTRRFQCFRRLLRTASSPALRSSLVFETFRLVPLEDYLAVSFRKIA